MTAKTVITGDHIGDPNAPIEYTFKSETVVIKIQAKNYAEARRKLNKWSNNAPGYKLIQRKT